MTIRTSLSVLAISTTLSFGWAALAQQNPATGTPPPSGAAGSGSQSQPGNSTGSAGSTSGGQQVISCLQRSAQGTQGAASGSGTAGSGTQSGSTGSAGSAGSAGSGATGSGSTGSTTGGSTAGGAGTPSTGAGSTAAGTTGTGSTGGTNTTGAAGSTGAGNAGTSTGGAAGSTTGTTGATTPGSTGSGSTGAGTTGSAGSGSTTTGTPSTGNTTASTPGTTPANGGAAGGKNLSSLSSAEVCFLDKAAASNQFEIQSSQLALQKSTNSAVKKVAQMIITDHQAAGARLKTLAATYGAVPSSQIDTQQQQLIQTLRGQSGKNFDLVYLTQQVAAHNEAINLFTSYSQPASASDAAVRQFAAQTLPALKAHQQMVLSAQKSVSGASTTKPATGTPASSGSK